MSNQPSQPLNPNEYRKAIAGLLVPVVLLLASHYGLDIDNEQAQLIAELVIVGAGTLVAVWGVPNARPHYVEPMGAEMVVNEEDDGERDK